jgi:hypothetical protein
MAVNKKQQDDRIAMLIERGVAELRVGTPELFAEARPLSEEAIEELLRDDEEIQHIWDEVDRGHPDHAHVSAADLTSEDRGK